MPDRIASRVTTPRTASRRPTDRLGFRVFIDFDNTITVGDVLDGIIERFATGEEWRALETAWEEGRIGARECLDGQLRSLRGDWEEFTRHLDSVKLDPGFAALRTMLAASGIEFTIVSDNFDRFIAHILRRHHAEDVPCFSNHVEIGAGRVEPSFPYGNPACPHCAHCKKIHFLPPNDDDRAVIYIGDGRSDLCPAREADVVFAKASLLEALRAENVPCLAFDTLADVVTRLPTILHENRN